MYMCVRVPVSLADAMAALSSEGEACLVAAAPRVLASELTKLCTRSAGAAPVTPSTPVFGKCYICSCCVSLCAVVYVHIHTYTCIHTNTNVTWHVCMYLYMHTYICTCMHTDTCINIYSVCDIHTTLGGVRQQLTGGRHERFETVTVCYDCCNTVQIA